MDSIDELSAIIVTYQGDGLLRDCLDSLGKVYGDRLETVVVDNAASPETAALAARYPSVRYVSSPGNPGFAGGNNRGLPFATRKYILLLNNDTLIHEDSFTPLVRFLADHPKVGIVQGTMNVPALGDGLDDCGILMTPFGIQRHLHRGEPTATTRLEPRRVFAAKGAMLMFRREVLERVNPLFYDHFVSYYEETDFCHRAALAGWETWFVPTPPIDHLGGMTSNRFRNEDIWSRYFRNILWSFHRNYGFFGHVFTIPCFVLAAAWVSPRALYRALQLLQAPYSPRSSGQS